MSDDLRTHIAAVLSREIPHIGVAADAVADAVIRELGLHLQPAKGHYRYVTDWVADV